MSRRRVSAAIAVAAAAAVVLSGCQSRLGAAALVGDQRISEDELQTLVRDALASPGVRDALPKSSYKGDLATYRRTVLNLEVELALAEAAGRRLNIGVDERKVGEQYRVYERQAGSPAQFVTDLAAKDALSPELFREFLRTQVIEAAIGYQAGGAHKPTEAELRRLYEQFAASEANATLTLVQVPDEAAARDAVARVQKDPAALDALGKQYADLQQAPPSPQPYPLARLPGDLQAKLSTLQPGDVFSYNSTAGGRPVFLVIRFGGIQRPTLESSRAQLETQSLQAAAQAGRGYLGTVAKQIGVQVNPRYGSWNGDKLMIEDFVNPAVRPAPKPATPSTSPGAPTDGSNQDGTG